LKLISFFKRLAPPPWLAEVLALAAILVFAFLGIGFAHRLDVTMDEGTYLMKGLLYVKGVYVPFQDYGPLTNKTPLSFYIPGLAQVLFGPGLRTGRYFSVFLGVLTLLGVWATTRRLGNRWWACVAVWAMALNIANITYYSLAISQVITACLLAWMFYFTLGKDRPLWQLILGSVLAVAVVMTRQNMLPVLPLILLYILWENGWRKSLWVITVAVVLFAALNIPFMPKILKGIWSVFLPGALSRALGLKSASTSTGTSVSVQDYNLLSQVYVIWEGLRFNFTAFFGAFISWILWPRRSKWQSDSAFKIAVALTVILLTLTAAHMYAALGMDYCLYCYSGYLSFFSHIALLLPVVCAASWERQTGFWRRLAANLLVILSCAGLAYAAYQELEKILLNLPFPRVRGLSLQGGTTELWRMLNNKFGWSYETLQQVIPTIFGLLFGMVLVFGIWLVMRKMSAGKSSVFSNSLTVLLCFWLLGTLLAPTRLLGGAKEDVTCDADIIAAHEKAGAQLAAQIPANSLVLWINDISPLPLLYLKEARIFPPQLNHWYTYRQGGDPDKLYKAGYWNEELALNWMEQADYLLIAERYHDTWINRVDTGKFEELNPTDSVVPCRDQAFIRVFKRVH
jgi:hypothetical protein